MEAREIKYEDIRKGDRIWAKWAPRDAVRTTEGVAHHDSGRDWTTAGGQLLVAQPWVNVTIYLLERPEIVLPPVGTWVRFLVRGEQDEQIGQVAPDGIDYPRAVESMSDWFHVDEIVRVTPVKWVDAGDPYQL